MSITRLALSRPYTSVVLALMLLIFGIISLLRTPADIFPNIDIPVVGVVWTYTGMPAEEMGSRITSVFERVVPTTVNDVKHIESQSLNGFGIIKIFFQPDAKIDLAIAQVTAIAQTMLKIMPPGMSPPQILSYNASTVPIIQLVLSSLKLSEQELNDYGSSFIRTELATIKGTALPAPHGGKVRQIRIDLNHQAMQAYGITAQDVGQAIGEQNIILPSGTQKMGIYEYNVKLNNSPLLLEQLNELPIRNKNGTIYHIRDVAYVHDGFAPQTSIVRVDGKRAVLMPIQKTGSASTLDIIDEVKGLVPKIRDMMPEALKLAIVGDQSLFVSAAIKNVVFEAVIAATLTGLMILLFLSSWRSTLIITISIPLSILASVIVLSALGQTINIMTLGGLALAVGILVDDATVMIESINWHLEQGKSLEAAILDGADQISAPALVSTLCICIAFFPMFFLSDIAYYLFAPLAEAVIFAMLASYVLSRTLVPTLAKYLLRSDQEKSKNPKFFMRFQLLFENKFKAIHEGYYLVLQEFLKKRGLVVALFLGFTTISILLLTPWIGSDFFPAVDAGRFKLHVRAPTGVRIEETAKLCDEINTFIRQIIPAKEIDNIVDTIGLPMGGINLTHTTSAPIGAADADILVSLNPNHSPTVNYVRMLRKKLPKKFPGVTFSFLPADMVTQILNFGLPSPINLQIVGRKLQENRQYAAKLLEKLKYIPGIVDAHIHQAFNYPQLNVNVDRGLANQLGLTQFDVASNLLVSLSGSFQTNSTFWLNSDNGVSYSLVSQTPQYALTSLQDLNNIPIGNPNAEGQILGSLATVQRTVSSAVESHYNVQPVIDIFANIQDRDLGAVAKEIKKTLTEMHKDLPLGSRVIERGQIQTQHDSFVGLYYGLIFAVLLIYLLMVINFQSWKDPFIIITALPAALAGIVWILFVTGTTLSVPALIGAIMCMGVATANSILVVSFARNEMIQGRDALSAALAAGYTRLRPVLMTALAMVIGMLPMSFGLGQGGEQNAPLGRAVIGGLLFATVATLFFVPVIFSLIHGKEHANAN